MRPELDAMRPPSPDDLGRAPLWQNYAIAQAVQASRAQIPEHTLAFGIEVDGLRLRLRFQLSEATEEDVLDISDIAGDLEALVGPDAEVESVYEVRDQRQISAHDGVCWIFLSRA